MKCQRFFYLFWNVYHTNYTVCYKYISNASNMAKWPNLLVFWFHHKSFITICVSRHECIQQSRFWVPDPCLLPSAITCLGDHICLACWVVIIHTTKLLGGIFVSLHPSVLLSRIPCPLCSAYSTGWIHFIFIHLIKQLSNNFRRCVACKVSCETSKFEFWAIF